MDKDEIREHYEKVKGQSVASRELLETIKIRKFNNFIKTILINENVEKDTKVLDIGCGHGGDLNKFNRIRIAEYYGIDISSNSIAEATKRYRGSTIKYKASFFVGDAYNEKLETGRIFDIISIQFSLHYAFSCEESLHITLENLRSNLKVGGKVLATIPNQEVLLRRYKKYGNCYGNEYYGIKFHDSYETIKERKERLGISYEFTLKDSLDNCVEYLIDMDNLKKECESYGLKIINQEGFVEYFNRHAKANLKLHDVMIGEKLDPQELTVCAIYMVIVVERIL